MKKIYILEDNRIVLETLKFKLESEFQCEVSFFETGNDLCLNLLRQPDLIILDYFIESKFRENGLSVLKKIKNINENIPVIIFSGQHNLKCAVELIQEGAVDYVNKNDTASLDEIEDAVRNIFNYRDAKKELGNIEKSMEKYKKQFSKLRFFGICLLITLLIALFYRN